MKEFVSSLDKTSYWRK